MKHGVTLLLALCLSLTVLSVAGAAQWTEISAPELKTMMDTEQVKPIFPLSRIEHRNLHIVGDVNIPLSDLETKLPADKNAPLVFYCLGRK